MPNLLSKFQGCILGQCLGDALGRPVEGMPSDICTEYVEQKMRTWFDGATPDDFWVGQYTDDSQLARDLLDSMIDNKGFNPEDYARRIALIFKENRIVGRGLATDKAARKLQSGTSWEHAGCPAPDAGNGTAMRAAPIGLFYHNEPDSMIIFAHQQGYITHQDKRCSAGSIAVAGAVALVLHSDTIQVEPFTKQLADWMREYSDEFADFVLRLPRIIEMEPEAAVVLIAPMGKPAGFIDGWPGISPFVVPSVLWSLYSFLRHPDSYLDAIATSIAVGGDVDTTAAMTGAISGAYLGIEALPKNLVTRINDYDQYDYDYLMERAKKCHELVVP